MPLQRSYPPPPSSLLTWRPPTTFTFTLHPLTYVQTWSGGQADRHDKKLTTLLGKPQCSCTRTLTFLSFFICVIRTACQSLRNHLWGFVNGHCTNKGRKRGRSCEREADVNTYAACGHIGKGRSLQWEMYACVCCSSWV